MNGYEGIFGLMMAECDRKRDERVAERERTREERERERMRELFEMAMEVSAWR